jgi:hypothetical protein
VKNVHLDLARACKKKKQQFSWGSISKGNNFAFPILFLTAHCLEESAWNERTDRRQTTDIWLLYIC